MNPVLALLHQRLRRDGTQVALWIIATALLGVGSYIGVQGSFGTLQDRRPLLAAALANPVVLLFRGLPSGTDEGAFAIFLILPWLSILAALMSTFLAVRHTRGDEEAGRGELVSATPIPRALPLLATAGYGLLANMVLAAATAGGLLAVGLGVPGSLLSGVATATVGSVFLGVGLVAAQLARTSRGANSLAVWVTVSTFILAGVGNALGRPSDDLTRMESSWLVWLSPFGWAEQTRPFADDAGGPLLLGTAFGAALIGMATWLTTTRDSGEGVWAERPGRAYASAALGSPIGLVWRVARGGIAGWTVGGVLAGVLSTSLASVIEEIGADNPAIVRVISQIAGQSGIQQGVVTTFFTMVGILASCCAVQVVCRARQEEAQGLAEPVLAAPVGRVRWLRDYLLVAVGGVLSVIAAAVAGASLGVAVRGGPGSLVQAAAVAGSGQAAAASFFLVLTAVVFVVLPRATLGLGWSLVLIAMLGGLFGPLFGLPEALTRLSPVATTPEMVGSDVDLRGLWWLLLVVVAGGATALTLMRRRELHPD
jgi:ABC-2 type transport system permease protein